MSNLDNILEKIAQDAREQADVILKNAKAQADSIIESKKSGGLNERHNMARRTEEEAARIVERSISQAQLKARDMKLRAKEEIIARCLELVKYRLNNLEEKDYITYLQNNLKSTDLNYQSEIRVPRRYREAVKNMKLGWNISDEDAKSGFEIHTGKVIYNCDFSSVVDARRDEFEAEIAQELFGE